VNVVSNNLLLSLSSFLPLILNLTGRSCIKKEGEKRRRGERVGVSNKLPFSLSSFLPPHSRPDLAKLSELYIKKMRSL
jgi:hypothetical protein